MARQFTSTFRGQIIDPIVTYGVAFYAMRAYWLESNASFNLPVSFRESYSYLYFNFPSVLSEGRIAFRLKPNIQSNSNFMGGLYSGSNYYITLRRDDGDMSNRTLYLTVNGTDYFVPMELRMPFENNIAHVIEIYWKCNGANGIVKLYQNGICLISLNPINVGATNLSKWMFGSTINLNPSWDYIEWVALEDADVDCSGLRFARLAPNAAGSSTQLSAVPSGSNYDLVDAPLTGISSLAAYCLADSANEQDSYNLAAPPSDIDTINAVRVLGVAGQQADGFLAKALVRTGGTDYVGDSYDVQHSYGLFQHRWALNPNTNAAWSVSDLDGLEAGVKAVSS